MRGFAKDRHSSSYARKRPTRQGFVKRSFQKVLELRTESLVQLEVQKVMDIFDLNTSETYQPVHLPRGHAAHVQQKPPSVEEEDVSFGSMFGVV